MAMDNDSSLRDLKKQFIKLAREDGVTNRPAGGAKLILVGNAKPPHGPKKYDLKNEFTRRTKEDAVEGPPTVEGYANETTARTRTDSNPDAQHAE